MLRGRGWPESPSLVQPEGTGSPITVSGCAGPGSQGPLVHCWAGRRDLLMGRPPQGLLQPSPYSPGVRLCHQGLITGAEQFLRQSKGT